MIKQMTVYYREAVLAKHAAPVQQPLIHARHSCGQQQALWPAVA